MNETNAPNRDGEPGGPARPDRGYWECTVVKVYDGDTITCLTRSGKKHRIRLQNIDAPEADQKYGKEAGDFLRNLVLDRKIRLRYIGRDDYGRDLGIVFLRGENINEIMVATGNAWAFDYFLSEEDKERYVSLQREAKEQKLGLWKDENPQEPRQYRVERKILQKLEERRQKGEDLAHDEEPFRPDESERHEAPERILECRVIKVLDGNTVIGRAAGGEKHRIRLEYIDAPEPKRPHGREAAEFLKKLVLTRKVRARLIDDDLYGSELAVIECRGKNVNEAMVAAGHAWAYEYFLTGGVGERYLSLQREAREKKLGIWSDEKPLEHRDYRIMLRITESRQNPQDRPGGKNPQDRKNPQAWAVPSDRKNPRARNNRQSQNCPPNRNYRQNRDYAQNRGYRRGSGSRRHDRESGTPVPYIIKIALALLAFAIAAAFFKFKT